MSEKDPKRREIQISEELSVRETHLGRSVGLIPSDGQEPFGLTFLHGYDFHMQMVYPNEGVMVPLNGIRFRTQTGGGFFPLIFEEAGIISKSLIDHKGQVPPGYNGLEDMMRKEATDYKIEICVLKDNFPVSANVLVRTSKKANEPKIEIIGIPCDDEDKKAQMDIQIQQNGDVVVKLREIRGSSLRFYQDDDKDEEGETEVIEGQMTFKTAENGGRYPIIAFAFTKIAERMLKAKKDSQRRQR